MAKKKTTSVNDLSSAELYELARQREKEERKRLAEENRQKIRELRARRRRLISEHQKEIKRLDDEIARLSGRAPARKPHATGRSISDVVMEILQSVGGIATTQQIREGLAQRGIQAPNLSQTLAYLKRQGRIVSPERATYQIDQG